MSDKGEKTCPLCAEEMDLTDQQLKPCKCGYDICVWCWHHIMEMAEKNDTEGLCPACRIPYDKERIVGTTANCERLVAEINVEKKKSQKTKPKSSEGKKQLSSVRVIQRNLVYIMGLPLHFGDEDILYRREYFGQYGRVLKVSMSRTAAGVIQQFPNSTCSVYITYSKEEEAIRCIQSVHGYLLEGKLLRACFGTTKYCHAWLRNVPCSNPDCLYLHEFGSHEDSFTKDEIISSYTRNRVQQIIDPANSQQRRSGNELPPPLDDHDSSVSASKPRNKNASSHPAMPNGGSPPNGSLDRAIGLPPAASWATRASNSQPLAASLVSSNGVIKQKSDKTDSRVISSATASVEQTSSSCSYAPKKLSDENHSIQSKGKVDELRPVRHYNGMIPRPSSWEKYSSLSCAHTAADASSYSPSPASVGSDSKISLSSVSLDSFDQFGESSDLAAEAVKRVHADGHMENLCSDMSVMSINRNSAREPSSLVRLDHPLSEYGMARSSDNQGSQPSISERYRESLASSSVIKTSPSLNEMYIASIGCDWTSNSQNQASKISPDFEEDIICFDNQQLKDPEVISRPSYFTNSSKLLSADHSGSHSLQYSGAHCAPRMGNYQLSEDQVSDISSLHEFSGKLVSNGTAESLDQSTGFVSTVDHIFPHKNDGEYMGMQQRNDVSDSNVSLNSRENNIISDTFSLDFDPWDESTSPQALDKLLIDSDEHDFLNSLSKSLKVHKYTQSRFSFARQDESVSQSFDVEPPLNVSGQISESHTFSPFSQNRDSFMDNFGFVNGLSSNTYGDSIIGNGQNAIFANKLSASRLPGSAPPGFSVPSRSPPPGFSQERVEQAYSSTSGNHLLDTSSSLRNSYQTSKSGSFGGPGDIFTDPANMEGFINRPNSGPGNWDFDTRSDYAQSLNPLDDEASLRWLTQRSIGQHRNLRYWDISDNYSLVNDSYGISSSQQVNNLSPFAQLSAQQPRNSRLLNGHWDGWNEISGGNSRSMADHLSNERLGFNKLYSSAGYEDSKFRVPGSGDFYSRTFGM